MGSISTYVAVSTTYIPVITTPQQAASTRKTALVLAHEMGHCVSTVDLYLIETRQLTEDELEQRNINRWERPIASELGEYMRINHKDKSRTVTAEHSTDWGVLVPRDVEDWWYWLPWNLLKPRKVFVNQNPWTLS